MSDPKEPKPEEPQPLPPEPRPVPMLAGVSS